MPKQEREHLEQCALMTWVRRSYGKYPALRCLFAVPNGGKLPYKKLPNGKVWSPQRAKLVKEGLKKGVYDLFLSTMRGGFGGLYLEMKWGKNTESEDQVVWGKLMREEGYKAVVCWSYEEAKKEILDYLKLKD